jgi:hypothetical protein
VNRQPGSAETREIEIVEKDERLDQFPDVARAHEPGDRALRLATRSMHEATLRAVLRRRGVDGHRFSLL